MVTSEEIVRAVERLKDVGLWAKNVFDFKEQIETSRSVRLIWGSTHPPELIGIGVMEAYRLGGDSFHVELEEHDSRYKAVFKLGQVSVTIKTADNLDEVIASLTSYAYLQSKLPQDSISILEAIFQLKQAGLSTHIANESALEAKDKLHTFSICWQDTKWSVQVDHAHNLRPNLIDTLEEAVNQVVRFYTIT
jgi:hypothetical protein